MITLLAIHANPQTLGTKRIRPLSQNLKITPQKTVQQIFKFVAAWSLKCNTEGPSSSRFLAKQKSVMSKICTR